MFFLALYEGETVVIDPRVSEKDFYNQLIKLKPNVALTTGSAWEAFFNQVEHEMLQGKSFDFSYAKGWMVGGEGSDTSKFLRWDMTMKKAKAIHSLHSGYGLSELFSAVSAETAKARYDFSKSIMSVGIPYAGITMGVFDKAGKELGYGFRGELWIKSKSTMKGYYHKPELTAQTKVDSWIHTGDLAEIDENGFVYIWGRLKDTITLPDGQEVFLFDIANKIKENKCIDDAIVLSLPTENGGFILVAHNVWSKPLNEQEKADCLTAINKAVEESFPEGIRIAAYAEHDGMLPYSPTTLKKDKNKMSRQTDGLVQVMDGKLTPIKL